MQVIGFQSPADIIAFDMEFRLNSGKSLLSLCNDIDAHTYMLYVQYC